MIWYLIAGVAISFLFRHRFQARQKLLKQHPEIFLKREIALTDYEIAALRNFKSQTRSFVFMLVTLVGLAFWFGTYQPLQVKKDLEVQSKVYLESIPEGWRFQCDDIFENFIGNGTYLYAGNYQYDASWCNALMTPSVLNVITSDETLFQPSEYSDVEGARSKGFNVGARFALSTVFSQVPYLCFGTDCITESSIQDWYLEQNRDSLIP